MKEGFTFNKSSLKFLRGKRKRALINNDYQSSYNVITCHFVSHRYNPCTQPEIIYAKI